MEAEYIPGEPQIRLAQVLEKKRSLVLWGIKKSIQLTALLAIVIPIGLGINWWFFPSVPNVSPDEVTSIEVYLEPRLYGRSPEKCQKETRIMVTDPDKIQKLLEVFQSAERTSQHKCGPSGTITIQTKGGSAEPLKILPGHDAKYYEYRYGSRINRVNRQQFLMALRAFGLKQVLLNEY